MQLTLNASKYSAPRLPAVVSRSRLLHRLQAGPANGLTLVLGQAAQGKTTLAADFLRQAGLPAAWLCLDAEDASEHAFLSLLVHALERALPESGLGVRLDAVCPTAGPHGDVARAAGLLEDLCAHLPDRVQIVLDGVDRLPEQAPARLLIVKLCLAATDRGRVWLLSRRRPDFRYQRAVVDRRTLVIANEELAFNRREIHLYFESLHHLKLPAEYVSAIYQATDGWTGALVLLAQALERVEPADRAAYLAQNLPAKLSGETLRYFSEEVFNRMPPVDRSFLMQAAVPDVFDSQMALRLLEGPDTAARLERLLRSNAFVHAYPAPDGQGTSFRFNSLFQEFLRSRYESTVPPEARRRYYCRIAEAWDSKGDLAAAVRWYLRALDYGQAAACLKKISTDLLIRGRMAELRELIGFFPARLLETDPWLFFVASLTRGPRGAARGLADLEQAYASFAAAADDRGQMLALAHLIEAHIFTGQSPAVCLKWIEEGRRWLTSQSGKHYYSWAKCLLWLHIGLGYIAIGLDLNKGLSAARNALLLARRMRDAHLTARATIVSVLGLAMAGDFERADEALAGIDPAGLAGLHAEYDTLQRLVQVKLAMRRGDLETAQERIKGTGRDIETYGLLFLYPAYVDASGFLQLYRGRHIEALATSRHLSDVAALAGNPVYSGMSRRLGAMVHYFQGNFGQAADEAREAIDYFETSGPTTLHLVRARQVLALACIRLGRFQEARNLLEQARVYYTETANHLSLSETCLIMGFLEHAAGRTPAARPFLEQGLEIAARLNLRHFIVLSPQDCAGILELAGCFGLQAPESFSRRAAGQTARQGVPEAVAGQPPPPPRRPSARDHLQIRSFGGFSVLRNGSEPIEEGQWGGNRPKLLLKAILVHGLREIPKDLLVDELWPESSPQTGVQNFKVTLHRLRKILEPGLKKSRSSAFVHLKNNLVSLDRELCRVDLEEFLQACKDVKRCIRQGDSGRVIELGQRVMSLYQGDFLPEEPYAPWIEMKRWALKDSYIQVVLAMAAIHQRRARSDKAEECCRAVLKSDACREEAARLLMRLYALQGLRSEAMQVYERLRLALREEAGVDPDPATAELFERVRSGTAAAAGAGR